MFLLHYAGKISHFPLLLLRYFFHHHLYFCTRVILLSSQGTHFLTEAHLHPHSPLFLQPNHSLALSQMIGQLQRLLFKHIQLSLRFVNVHRSQSYLLQHFLYFHLKGLLLQSTLLLLTLYFGPDLGCLCLLIHTRIGPLADWE